MESHVVEPLEETQHAAEVPGTLEEHTNASGQASGAGAAEVPPVEPVSGGTEPSSEEGKVGDMICEIIMNEPSKTGPCIWVGGHNRGVAEAVRSFCDRDKKVSVVRVYEWEMELNNALRGGIHKFNHIETQGLQGLDALLADYGNDSNKSLQEEARREGRDPACDPLSLSNITRTIIQKSNGKQHELIKRAIWTNDENGSEPSPEKEEQYRGLISHLLIDTIMKTNVVAGTPDAISKMITHLKPHWKTPLIIMDDAQKIPEAMSHRLTYRFPDSPTLFLGEGSQLTDPKDAEQRPSSALERACRAGKIDVDLNNPEGTPSAESNVAREEEPVQDGGSGGSTGEIGREERGPEGGPEV